MEQYFLGIDIGTTAIKFGVIAEDDVRFKTAVELATYYENKQNYQKAEDVLQGVIEGIKQIPESFREKISTIGFSVPMHSCMPVVDGKYEKIFIWSDNQAEETIEAFKKTPEATRFYLKSGTPIHPMSPFAKILYFQQTKQYGPRTRYYGFKELILNFFTGSYRIDRSTASATGLFHTTELTWDEEILDYLKIQEDQLAEIVDSTAMFPIQKNVAEELELNAGTMILAGASDGCLAAYASYRSTGISDSLTIGTSAAIRKVTDHPHFESSQQNFCYYLNEEFYVVGAPSNNGGCVLEWAQNQLFDENFFEQLPKWLEKSPQGANGLRFHPYINGERAPFWRNDVSAQLKYLTIKHTKQDIARSIAEGILMNLKILAKMVETSDHLAISGGFFRTEALGQLTADILGADCLLSEKNEPVFGLYYLLYPQKNQRKDPKQHFVSDPAAKEEYEQLFSTYFE
ncbi:gluconokinase [Enterococcus mediterraneensis]|uniref:gluconokinase n=1 Tax=Enterococcus mediterraneensis TaxID=2364791 RepID=UPI000F05F6B8|nr:FGGY family carbohydrate kinase [Enterococcus mediterraneensis]